MEQVDLQNKKDDLTKNNNLNNEKENSKNLGAYFGYYIFVTISAIIGFFFVLFLSRFVIKIKFENQINFLTNNKNIVSIFIALLAVILFIFISIFFKAQLKKIFFSEAFLYLYIGFLTTVISFFSFQYFNSKLNPTGGKDSYGWMIAEMLSFTFAVIFSYFADKIVVFKSMNFRLKKMAFEFAAFVSGRIFSEGISIINMYIIINILNKNELIAKTISCIIVIIINYLLSKFLIFKGTSYSEKIEKN